jgi:hypothetical protein
VVVVLLVQAVVHQLTAYLELMVLIMKAVVVAVVVDQMSLLSLKQV